MASRAIFRFEKSALFLVLSNIFTIVIALLSHWRLSDVMWIYWGQSVVIGFFNFIRILCLKEFSTEGFRINDRPVAPTKATQRQTATFFAFHYGFFHFIYCIFLFSERADISKPGVLGIVMCVIVFAVNHGFSFKYNLARDLARKPNIGTIMFFPYARIIPMHLTIILGSHFGQRTTGTLVLFLSLKTLADLIMHLVEHRSARPKIDVDI